MKDIMEQVKKEPTCLSWGVALKRKLGVAKLPPLVGVCFFGIPSILITSFEPLQDLYVNKTQLVTKAAKGSDNWVFLMNRSVLFD